MYAVFLWILKKHLVKYIMAYYMKTASEEGPIDAAFQNHLERQLNPADVDPIVMDDLVTQVSIPILLTLSLPKNCSMWLTNRSNLTRVAI